MKQTDAKKERNQEKPIFASAFIAVAKKSIRISHFRKTISQPPRTNDSSCIALPHYAGNISVHREDIDLKARHWSAKKNGMDIDPMGESRARLVNGLRNIADSETNR